MRSAHILGLFTLILGIQSNATLNSVQQSFQGSAPGDERKVFGVKLCWCPPGKFTMGSPRGEPERRPGEDQVEVTLTKGFWADEGWPCRSAFRVRFEPERRYDHIGFRVVAVER